MNGIQLKAIEGAQMDRLTTSLCFKKGAIKHLA